MNFEMRSLKQQVLSYIKSIEKMPSINKKKEYKIIVQTLRENQYIPNKTSNGYLIDINAMSMECLNAIYDLSQRNDKLIKNEI
jgi:hydrogenase maturation factor HypF (carbamoyltransferase family)